MHNRPLASLPPLAGAHDALFVVEHLRVGRGRRRREWIHYQTRAKIGSYLEHDSV